MNRNFMLLLSMLLPFLTCCSASASKKGMGDTDSTAIESQTESEPQGMLKAFGLKGKVKILTLSVDVQGENIDFVYSFDPNGNYRKTPNYQGELVSLDGQCDTDFFSIVIDHWKWTKIGTSRRWGGSIDYAMTKYDEQNRPIEATVSIEDKIAKRNVPITYSGSDSHGNYTMMKFGTEGIKIEDYYVSAVILHVLNTINVKIEYWPDDATMADVPTELTKSIATDLVKRANRQEAGALTRDFKRFLDMEATIPWVGTAMVDLTDFGGDGREHFYEGSYADGTILSDVDNTNIPQIEVRIGDIQMEDSGDAATVTFYYAAYYEGKYHEEDLSDPDHFGMIMCKFENGKWLVDDFGSDLVYGNYKYYPGSTYKKDNEFMKNSLNAIKTGTLERDLRQKFGNDPKLNQYLKKVSDFKKKYDIK